MVAHQGCSPPRRPPRPSTSSTEDPSKWCQQDHKFVRSPTLLEVGGLAGVDFPLGGIISVPEEDQVPSRWEGAVILIQGVKGVARGSAAVGTTKSSS